MEARYFATISYDLTCSPDYNAFNKYLKEEDWISLKPNTTWKQAFLAEDEADAHKQAKKAFMDAVKAYRYEEDDTLKVRSLVVSLGTSVPKQYP